jgi:hypothetical protein
VRLFHFSDTGDIQTFDPRPVATPSKRKPGKEWLNGRLVWAIDDWHQALYLFPRECPRVLIWKVEGSTAHDWDLWAKGSAARMIAFIEEDWLDAVRKGAIFRYELPGCGFQPVKDAGMWVSETAVEPIRVEMIADLPAALKAQQVELHTVNDLAALRAVWSSTLHASGIRLRNARSRSARITA